METEFVTTKFKSWKHIKPGTNCGTRFTYPYPLGRALLLVSRGPLGGWWPVQQQAGRQPWAKPLTLSPGTCVLASFSPLKWNLLLLSLELILEFFPSWIKGLEALGHAGPGAAPDAGPVWWHSELCFPHIQRGLAVPPFRADCQRRQHAFYLMQDIKWMKNKYVFLLLSIILFLL